MNLFNTTEKPEAIDIVKRKGFIYWAANYKPSQEERKRIKSITTK